MPDYTQASIGRDQHFLVILDNPFPFWACIALNNPCGRIS